MASTEPDASTAGLLCSTSLAAKTRVTFPARACRRRPEPASAWRRVRARSGAGPHQTARVMSLPAPKRVARSKLARPFVYPSPVRAPVRAATCRRSARESVLGVGGSFLRLKRISTSPPLPAVSILGCAPPRGVALTGSTFVCLPEPSLAAGRSRGRSTRGAGHELLVEPSPPSAPGEKSADGRLLMKTRHARSLPFSETISGGAQVTKPRRNTSESPGRTSATSTRA
jgi:hypothetical protein